MATEVSDRDLVRLSQMVERFAAWLEKNGYDSYDPYDVWGTGYGQLSRRLYYAKNPVGKAMVAPVMLMEILCPWMRVPLVKKDRYPTADAQLLLAFLNLHDCGFAPVGGGQALADNSGKSSGWLGKAARLSEDLLARSIPGYSGHCWGYPFDWRHVNGLMPKGTPHITATPYCYEAFAGLFDRTGDEKYLDVARSTSKFVFHDLNDTPTGKDSCAGSYSPMDRGKVVNANAYRAWVLFDAAERFNNEEYREKAWKNLRFILQNQREDGSWLYAIDNPREAFIDHFHTCFVLKNLFKINRGLKDKVVKDAVINGYRYYRRSLFDAEDNPRSYTIAPRVQIVRTEMYNYAEAITLGVWLKNEIPEAFELANRLAGRLAGQYQLKSGTFVTRVYSGGFRHRFPFLRWPQAQLFLATTALLKATTSDQADI